MQILEANVYRENRDAQCASDVANMAEMGKFELDFLVYGCAYLENETRHFRISDDANDIYQFLTQSPHQGVYPTSVMSHLHQTLVPSGMHDKIAYETKLSLARRLKACYSRDFFDLLVPFTKTAPTDASASLLMQMADEIEGHFNEWELQLLEGTMDIAFEAKQLTESSFKKLRAFIDCTRHQMEDDPVIQEQFSRTFTGFCYQTKQGKIKTFFDAQPLPVLEKQKACQQKGLLTGPIIQKTYWFKTFNAFAGLRQDYEKMLKHYQDKVYFERLNCIKAMPAVIATEEFSDALQILKNRAATEQEIGDFVGYGYRWNVLPLAGCR